MIVSCWILYFNLMTTLDITQYSTISNLTIEYGYKNIVQAKDILFLYREEYIMYRDKYVCY
jgi:hypothetical protein